jgi:hypothetical protein
MMTSSDRTVYFYQDVSAGILAGSVWYKVPTRELWAFFLGLILLRDMLLQ